MSDLTYALSLAVVAIAIGSGIGLTIAIFGQAKPIVESEADEPSKPYNFKLLCQAYENGTINCQKQDDYLYFTPEKNYTIMMPRQG